MTAAAPILDVEKLTIRFGGLTAVKQLDLRVDPGQIFSVIGPNGAGKTTVFNAVTGIYEPTAGTIQFAGRRLRRAFTWRSISLFALVALLTGLAAGVISLDVDHLWKLAVRQNYDYYAKSFNAAKAWQNVSDYLHAEENARAVRAAIAFVIGFVIGGRGRLCNLESFTPHARCRRPQRHRPHVSEHSIVRQHDGVGKRAGGAGPQAKP